MSSTRSIAVIVLIFVAAVLTGCATHAKRVECRWGLEPINTPAPTDTGTAP